MLLSTTRGGIAHGDGAGRDVPHHDGIAGDDAAVSDRHAGKDDRVEPDEAVLSDTHFVPFPHHEIMADDGDTRGDGRERSDMDALRVGAVEPSAPGNADMLADIHPVHVPVVVSSQIYHDLAEQEISYPGQHGAPFVLAFGLVSR